jgi:glycine/D-amino acid oxidase-like deaminating enzyme
MIVPAPMDPRIEPHVPSYWLATAGPEPEAAEPVRGDRAVEVAVIGGGYTGLAAAHRLAATYGIDTVVLEAHRVGWGASGRNGGFVSMALGKLGLEARIRAWGLDAARRSIQVGLEALETVRTLCATEAIASDPQRDGYVHVAHRPAAAAELQARCALYRETLGYDGVEFLDRAALERDGYLRGPAAHGAIRFRDGFGLHPLKYARGLAAAARRRGAPVHEGSPVVAWERGPGGHRLATPGGTVRARRVVLATNGYTPEALHPFFRGRTMPATSNIVVTPPLPDAVWRDVGMLTTQVYSDTRKLLFYWRRLPDDRLLFGGRAGLVDSPASLARRRRWLEGQAAAKLPPLRGVGSEYFWHGRVCLAYDFTPHVGTADGDSTVAYAMGYMGSGVAMATYGGALAADLAAGKAVPRDTPLTGAGLPRFPLPFLRRAYLAGAYLVYGLEDRRR